MKKLLKYRKQCGNIYYTNGVEFPYAFSGLWESWKPRPPIWEKSHMRRKKQ